MSKSSTPTMSTLIGKEVSLHLNDGKGILKKRAATITSADSVGIAYTWDFRGSPRSDFAPWQSVHWVTLKHGPSKDFPQSGWGKTFKKVKPSESGMGIVGKVCEVQVRDLGLKDEERFTTFDNSLVIAIDDRSTAIVHSRIGQVYTMVFSNDFVVNIEYREKKDTRPPGMK